MNVYFLQKKYHIHVLHPFFGQKVIRVEYVVLVSLLLPNSLLGAENFVLLRPTILRKEIINITLMCS